MIRLLVLLYWLPRTLLAMGAWTVIAEEMLAPERNEVKS
jgi:hypothetical protein